MGNQTISRINIRSNISCKMLRLSLILALVFVGISSALPVAQQSAAGGTAGGQGDQRIFGNLLGAVQGAWNGLTRPEQYNNNFGFGYPLNTSHFGGGGFQGGFNQGYNQGGWNQGGWNQGYGGGYNQGYGGFRPWG